MPVEIRWVKQRLLLPPHYSKLKRRWWPVYWPPHSDPELGPVGANPHVHIAWNRVPQKTREQIGAGVHQLAKIVLAANSLQPKKAPAPIVSDPVAPILSKDYMIRTWWRYLNDQT